MYNIELRKERLRESRDTYLIWFGNVPTSTERQLYFAINDLGLHHYIYIGKILNPNYTDVF